MWTRERNHMVYTEGFGRSLIPKAIRSSPWVYVAMPGQHIEYMQMHESDDSTPKHRPSVVRQVWRMYVFLKRLTLL